MTTLPDPTPPIDGPPGPRELPRVGWREWILLPDHGTRKIKVKVDTGARTSALHAESMAPTSVDGVPHLRFQVHPSQRTRRGTFDVLAPLVDEREVRSSSGAAERRPVVLLRLALGPTVFETEVTLTRRDQMGFRMLLGRTALQHRFLVDPSASFLQGHPVRAASPPSSDPRT